MEKTFFFDTYALVEIFNGNLRFEQYKTCNVITTYLHLFELFYNLRKIYEKNEVMSFFNKLKETCIDLDFNWILDASEFRLKNKKDNLSYADCLGYIISKKLNVKFLTGDKQFENMENVEFLK